MITLLILLFAVGLVCAIIAVIPNPFQHGALIAAVILLYVMLFIILLLTQVLKVAS